MYKFTYECNYKTNLKGDYKRHLNFETSTRNITIKTLNHPKDDFLMKRTKRTRNKRTKCKKRNKKGTKEQFLHVKIMRV